MEGAIMAGVSARRTSCTDGEAAVLREKTGKRTAEARRGTGPRPSPESEETTAGRPASQQGPAATCTDSWTKPSCVGCERGEVWRMRSAERCGWGKADRGWRHAPLGGVTPQGGAGALGTVMAIRVTPYETLCSIAMVNGADGSRHSKPGT